MLEAIKDLILIGHWIIFAGIALACCSAGVLFYRLISNRLAGFIYRMGR